MLKANGQIEAVIFDKDGTLFDFRRTWAGWAQRLLGELGRGDAGRTLLLGQMIGFDPRSGIFDPDSPVIAGTASEIADLLAPVVGGNATILAARMNALAAEVSLVEAVPLDPCLSVLRARGLRLALVTNDAEAPAHAHLAAAGVSAHFEFVAGYDSGHGAKPAPGQLLAFARMSGIAPARIVMVGDSLHDLAAGRAAGMRTVGVLTGMATAEDLAPLADAVLADIGALDGWIVGL